MLFREINAVCSENPMDIKTVCGQNAEFLKYIAAVSYRVITAT
jgi:hypothetical protein